MRVLIKLKCWLSVASTIIMYLLCNPAATYDELALQVFNYHHVPPLQPSSHIRRAGTSSLQLSSCTSFATQQPHTMSWHFKSSTIIMYLLCNPAATYNELALQVFNYHHVPPLQPSSHIQRAGTSSLQLSSCTSFATQQPHTMSWHFKSSTIIMYLLCNPAATYNELALQVFNYHHVPPLQPSSHVQ